MSKEALHALTLVKSLGPAELQFLRGIVAGESQVALASRLKLDATEGERMRKALFEKLGAKVTADAVRIGILAGL